MRAWPLLLLLLPVALAQSLVTISCHGREVRLQYEAKEGTVTFLYGEDVDREVLEAFVLYMKLRRVFPNLLFISPSTAASLSSLAATLEDYELRVKQAERLAGKSFENIKERSRALRLQALELETSIKAVRDELRAFLESPYCGFEINTDVFRSFDAFYNAAVSLLEAIRETKARIVEENDPELAASVGSLLTPPFDRGDLDRLRAGRDTDWEALRAVLPKDSEIEELKSLIEKEEARRELEAILATEINGMDVESAVNFVLVNRGTLKLGWRADEARELYEEVLELAEKGEYGEAAERARRLVVLLRQILEAGWKEESSPLPAALLLLIVIGAIIYVLRRRGRNEEADDLLGLDDVE